MSRADDLLQPTKPLLTERDLRGYSLARALLIADSDPKMVGRSLERDVHDELAKVPGAATRSGFLVPPDVFYFQRGAHEVATASKGGELKFTESREAIPFLFKLSKLADLGATILTGVVGDLSVPKVTAAMTTEAQPESQGGDFTSSAMTFSKVSLSPKLLGATTSYTRKLLQQSDEVAKINVLVASDLARAISTEVDRVGINGSGASNEPRGILNTTGIGDVAGGANGLQPTYANVVDMENEVGLDNADVGALGWLTNTKIRKRLRLTGQVSAANSLPVWVGAGEMLGFRAASSNNVPSNLTKGTSTTVCSAIIYGNFEELVIAQWGPAGVELVANPYTAARRGDVEVTAIIQYDVGLRTPESFCAMKDALA